MPRSKGRKGTLRTSDATALSLEKLLENTLDGIIVLDRDRRFVVFNSAAERLTGFSRDDVLGTGCSCHAFVDCHDEQGRSLAGFLCPAAHLSANDGSEGVRQRMRLRRRDGSFVWVETIYTPLRSASGTVELVLGVMRDISESHDHEQNLIATLAELRTENERLLEERRSRFGFGRLVSRSPQMHPVFERMKSALGNSFGVLIRGERGTGKELVARTIHEHGARRDGPFVVLGRERGGGELLVDGTRGGAMSAARHGTLYVEDISDLPSESQIALARMVPDRRGPATGSSENAAVRVIATIGDDPAAAIGAGKLRQELYYRLGVVSIELPPLRERREDIPSLVQHFLDGFNAVGSRQVSEVSPKAWSVLLAYGWPGNVAELSAAVESALVVGHGSILQANDLPPAVRGTGSGNGGAPGETIQLDPVLERVERQTILEALRQAKGQRNRAAQLMGISRSRLYRRMEMLGIEPEGAGESGSR